MEDHETHGILLSVISKGIAILDKDKQFSVVSSIEKGGLSAQHPLSFSNVANNSGSKESKRSTRIVTAPINIKLFQKLPSTRSTVQQNSEFGVSTFAVLSAGIHIKSSAEQSLELICNSLSNFPPKVSSVSVTRISSLWDEIKENASLVKLHQSSLEVPIAETILRYFSFDNRLIFGIMERPPQLNDERDDLAPQLGLIIRDGTGKYSWLAKCRYNDIREEASKFINSQSNNELCNYKINSNGETSNVHDTYMHFVQAVDLSRTYFPYIRVNN
jgi:hypothetical protein